MALKKYSIAIFITSILLDERIIKVRNVPYRILAYEDLITSKIKSARQKDFLDNSELQRIREEEE